MYYATLEHVACPRCHNDLVVDEVHTETDTNGQRDIVEGFLACQADPSHTFPIIDGVTLLLDDFTGYLEGKQNILDELLDAAESTAVKTFIADHLADVEGLQSDTWESLYPSYIWAHYDSVQDDDLLADALAAHTDSGVDAFAASHLMEVVESFLPEDASTESVGVDIGCSVGGNTHALSEAVSTAIGCDYSFRAIRTARAIRDSDGDYEYEPYLEGDLQQTRSVDPDIPAPDRTEFLVTDAAALPFAPATVEVVISMNMVDVLAKPRAHLVASDAVLVPGGRLVVCDPYDWARVSTADPADWLGGRDDADPSRSEDAIRHLIVNDLDHDIVAQQRHVPWTLSYHPRSYSTWIVDCVASEKPPETT